MISGRDADQVSRAADTLGRDITDASRVAGLAADVRDRAAVDALVAEAVRRFGHVDTLVNNAGVGRSRRSPR